MPSSIATQPASPRPATPVAATRKRFKSAIGHIISTCKPVLQELASPLSSPFFTDTTWSLSADPVLGNRTPPPGPQIHLHTRVRHTPTKWTPAPPDAASTPPPARPAGRADHTNTPPHTPPQGSQAHPKDDTHCPRTDCRKKPAPNNKTSPPAPPPPDSNKDKIEASFVNRHIDNTY